jgi:hypothetical protein
MLAFATDLQRACVNACVCVWRWVAEPIGQMMLGWKGGVLQSRSKKQCPGGRVACNRARFVCQPTRAPRRSIDAHLAPRRLAAVLAIKS